MQWQILNMSNLWQIAILTYYLINKFLKNNTFNALLIDGDILRGAGSNGIEAVVNCCELINFGGEIIPSIGVVVKFCCCWFFNNGEFVLDVVVVDVMVVVAVAADAICAAAAANATAVNGLIACGRIN